MTDDSDFAGHAGRVATLSLRVNDAETAAEWTRRGLDKDPQNAQLLAISKRLSAPSSDPPDRANRPREN